MPGRSCPTPRRRRRACHSQPADSEIDGVELVGKVTDRAGRPGIAVAMTTGYWGAKQRFTLIFDPTTPALLGEEKVLLHRALTVNEFPLASCSTG